MFSLSEPVNNVLSVIDYSRTPPVLIYANVYLQHSTV